MGKRVRKPAHEVILINMNESCCSAYHARETPESFCQSMEAMLLYGYLLAQIILPQDKRQEIVSSARDTLTRARDIAQEVYLLQYQRKQGIYSRRHSEVELEHAQRYTREISDLRSRIAACLQAVGK